MNLSFTIFELPVSVNSLYKRTKYGGLYLNPKVVAFKALAIIELEKLNISNITDKNVKVEIEFVVHKKNIDIDNLCKVVLDSLNKRVYKDDSQVFELNVKKQLERKKINKLK